VHAAVAADAADVLAVPAAVAAVAAVAVAAAAAVAVVAAAAVAVAAPGPEESWPQGHGKHVHSPCSPTHMKFAFIWVHVTPLHVDQTKMQ
jgi:hypothetical protein